MKINQSAIAEMTGVSIGTVSRILNMDKSFRATPETINKVIECANSIGYKIKSSKTKADQQTHSIGIIATISKELDSDSYFEIILEGIQKEAFNTNVDISFNYAAIELEYTINFTNIINSKVDGIIILGNIKKELFEKISLHCSNIVSIFEKPEGSIVDCVTVEYEKPFYELTSMLIDSGKTKIAFIGGDTYKNSYQNIEEKTFLHKDERFQGYLKALVDNNLFIDKSIIRDGHWDAKTAYLVMNEILDNNLDVDAVATAGDKMAFGAIKAIKERGYKIPEDIAIISFDNIDTSNFIEPPLTTVSFDRMELGKESLLLILDIITGRKKNCGRKVILPTEIILRKSTI